MDESDSKKKNYDLKIMHVELEGWASILVAGTVSDHSFCARLYRWHAAITDHEINQSHIFKLEVRRLADNQTVYEWDRGPDKTCSDPLGQNETTIGIVNYLTTVGLDKLLLGADVEKHQLAKDLTKKNELSNKVGRDLQIIKVERGQSGIGTWVEGIVNDHFFEAKILSEQHQNAKLQFGQSRICKLHILRLEDNQTVYAWDRGPAAVPKDPLQKERETLAIVTFLTSGALDQLSTGQERKSQENPKSEKRTRSKGPEFEYEH